MVLIMLGWVREFGKWSGENRKRNKEKIFLSTRQNDVEQRIISKIQKGNAIEIPEKVCGRANKGQQVRKGTGPP